MFYNHHSLLGAAEDEFFKKRNILQLYIFYVYVKDTVVIMYMYGFDKAIV